MIAPLLDLWSLRGCALFLEYRMHMLMEKLALRWLNSSELFLSYVDSPDWKDRGWTGRKADGDTEDTKTEVEVTAARLRAKCFSFLRCLLFRTANTSKLKNMSAHCSLHSKARKAEQFWAIKELVWLRQHSQTLSRELLCLRSYDSATEPPQFKGWKEWQAVGGSFQPEDQTITATIRVMSQPQASQSWYQICHTSAMFQKFTPALKPTNIHFWKHCHINNTFRDFFPLFWVSTGERQLSNVQQVVLQGRSSVRRGLTSTDHKF